MFHFTFLYKHLGISAPPVLPPPNRSLWSLQPKVPPSLTLGPGVPHASPICPMASLGTPLMTVSLPTSSVVTPRLQDIISSFGTPTSAFVSQFVSTLVVSVVITDTSPITAPGSSSLEATFSKITGVATPPVHGPLGYIDTSLVEAHAAVVAHTVTASQPALHATPTTPSSETPTP